MKEDLYLAICWMNPESGFEVAETSKMMNSFQSTLESLPPNIRQESEKRYRKLLREQEGKVLRVLLFKVDQNTKDIQSELSEQLKEEYPEAIVSEIYPFIQNNH